MISINVLKGISIFCLSLFNHQLERRKPQLGTLINYLHAINETYENNIILKFFILNKNNSKIMHEKIVNRIVLCCLGYNIFLYVFGNSLINKGQEDGGNI